MATYIRRKKHLKFSMMLGLVSTTGLIVFFLFMRSIDLAQNVWLHAINYLIIAAVVVYGLNKVKKRNNNDLPYLTGLGLGVTISFVTAVLFSFFMFIYMHFFDTRFITELEPELPFPMMGNPSSAAIALFIEILIAGSLVGFISMQLLKNKTFFRQQGENPPPEQ